MCTCDGCADIWASRVNRVRIAGSWANSGGRTLIATGLFSRRSRARYTTDIPPRPISPSISYWLPTAAAARSWRDSLMRDDNGSRYLIVAGMDCALPARVASLYHGRVLQAPLSG